MGQFERSHQHGPPLLGRVRAPDPFPDVVARTQPSDSLKRISLDYGFPLSLAYLNAGPFLARPQAYPPTCGASEIGVRLLRDAGCC